MKDIDSEIRELEQRLARRRLKVELLARASQRRAFGALASPAGLLGAGVLGFLAASGALRRHRHPDRRRAGKGRFAGIAGLLLSAGTSLGVAFLRAQFGSPAQIAQQLLAKYHDWKRSSTGAAAGRR